MKGNIHRELKQVKKYLPQNDDFKEKLHGDLVSYMDTMPKSKFRKKNLGGFKAIAVGGLCFALGLAVFFLSRPIWTQRDPNVAVLPGEGHNNSDASPFPSMEETQPSSDKTLLLVCADNKFGFMDLSGKVVIEPQFDYVSDFNEYGVATVMNYEGGQEVYGLLGLDGMLTDVNLWDIGSFNEGIAKVRTKDGKYGFIDYNGKWIVEPIYDDAKDFCEGMAAVGLISEDSTSGSEVDRWGFIDVNGKVVVELKYGKVNSFSNGLAYVQEQGNWQTAPNHYIDKNGQIIITLPWDWILSASEFDDDGTAIITRVSEEDRSVSLSGVINRQGELVLPFECQFISRAVNGLRIATPKKESSGMTKSGIIDMNGNWVVQPEYFEMGQIKDGLVVASVIKNERQHTGILRVDGTWLYEPVNYGVFSFRDDMVVFIEETGHDGVGVVMSLYDLKGNQLLKGEKYNYIDILSKEFIRCGTDGEPGSGIKKWVLQYPDGREIMPDANIYNAYRVDDENIIATVIKDDDFYTGLLNAQGDKWIIEPRYFKVFRYKDGIGGGIKMIPDKCTDDTLVFVTEVFDNQGNIIFTSPEETMSKDKFYSIPWTSETY